MLLKLYQVGQPILRKPARPVSKNQLATKRLQDLIDAMIATLRDAPGVGLAAPQVGEALRIVVIEDTADYHEKVFPALLKEQSRNAVPLRVIVNPQLELLGDDRALYFEGCLSIDGYVAAVSRYTKVRVSGLDRNGKPLSFQAENWFARIVQHEIEHLDGILYIDTMQTTSFMTFKNYTKLWNKSLQAKIHQTFS